MSFSARPARNEACGGNAGESFASTIFTPGLTPGEWLDVTPIYGDGALLPR
jgi:hypothetical protein